MDQLYSGSNREQVVDTMIELTRLSHPQRDYRRQHQTGHVPCVAAVRIANRTAWADGVVIDLPVGKQPAHID